MNKYQLFCGVLVALASANVCAYDVIKAEDESGARGWYDTFDIVMDNMGLNYTNPSYEGALIGVSDDNRAIYDFDKMVKSLMESEGWDEFEAIEWIEYNTMRANPYFDNSPIIMYPIDKEV